MKTWTIEEIKNLLETNKTMVIRSLMQLYNRQTAEEKYANETIKNNGVGFNGCDAKILTNIAKFYEKNQYLSEKQYNLVYKKIQKYAGQLTKIANGLI